MLFTVPTGDDVDEPLLFRDRVEEIERRKEVRRWENEVEIDGKAGECMVTFGVVKWYVEVLG